jgi:hypothetical protein
MMVNWRNIVIALKFRPVSNCSNCSDVNRIERSRNLSVKAGERADVGLFNSSQGWNNRIAQ